MYYTLHGRLLQSPEASIKSRGSRSKPPSSSPVKPQLPHCPTFLRGRLHHLLLQIGGARSGRLNYSLPVDCSLRSRDARRNPLLRHRQCTPEQANTRAFAITVAKTYAKGPS